MAYQGPQAADHSADNVHDTMCSLRDTPQGPHQPSVGAGFRWFAGRRDGYAGSMKLMRTAAMAGVAKKVYDEARKPHNQEKIRNAVASVKAKRSGGTSKHA